MTPITLLELSGGCPITVLAPHPDDESLGCGAILSAAFENCGAHVFCMTDGSRSHPGSQRFDAERLSLLRGMELVCALTHLGGCESDVTRLGVVDGQLPKSGDHFEQLCDQIAEHCRTSGSRTLITTDQRDHHADHKATAAIAEGVVLRLPHLRLFAYPVWSRWDDPASLEPETSGLCFFSAPWRERKRLAVNEHQSQRGLVVDDDPDGFVLPQAMIDRFVCEDERFFEVHHAGG